MNHVTLIVICGLGLFSCTPGPQLIRDLQTLPQQSRAYLDHEAADRPLVSLSCQHSLNQQFDSLYFAPWRLDPDSVCDQPVRESIAYYLTYPGWGENKLPRDSSWVACLAANADTSGFPDAGWEGITLVNTHLRALPTHRPIFRDFQLPGEGYPFDYLQVSSIAANTPIFIAHTSRDRSWQYVVSHAASGWVPVRDVARVDSAFQNLWQADSLVAVIRDGVPVYSDEGNFLFRAPLGSVFPKAGADSLFVHIRAAVSAPGQKAVPVTAVLPKSTAVIKPWRLTGTCVSAVIDALMGEPYGWGGLYQNRDCSATIKDLFAPFGIMLPRHSADQVQSGYDYVDLSGVSGKEKRKTVLNKGVPFLTLLWLPGHIMLYIGQEKDRPLAFHNLWGLRTKNLFGKQGRKIVGKSVVTTLSPDRGVRHADKSHSLLKRIRGMGFVVPPDSILIDF